jgi:hypothetical protein
MALFLLSSYIYCCFVSRKKSTTIGINYKTVGIGDKTKPSISFSGCGIRYHFYGGVAEYMTDNFETDNINILCTSGGIYAAVIMALGRKMTHWSDRDWKKCYDYWCNRSCYLWLDTDTFQRQLWRNYLPVDAYQTCTNKLFISVTRLGIYGFYEDTIYQYESNEALIDAIVCTIHIPGLYRILPKCNNRIAFDGCLTNVQPRINDKHTKMPTLCVKLFGLSNIDYGNKLSMKNLLKIVPPESCNEKIQEGYKIAKEKHNEFLRCGFIEK